MSVKTDLKGTDCKSVTYFGTFPDVGNEDKENVVSDMRKPEDINKAKLSVKTSMKETNSKIIAVFSTFPNVVSIMAKMSDCISFPPKANNAI